jgi:hypothetical protein
MRKQRPIGSMRPSATNNLASIRGEDIAWAVLTFPDAASAPDEPHYAKLRRGGRRVRIMFKRFKYKRGKTMRWFWTAESAVIV